MPSPRAATLDERPFAFREGPRGVLLLHGFSGTPFEVRWLGERLRHDGFSVLAPLLPGHGSHPEDLQRSTPEDWYQTASRALDELAGWCQRIAVAGFSMGALLALDLAANRPEKVAATVLMSTPYSLSGRLGLLLLLYAFTPMVLFMPMFPKPASSGEIADPSWQGRTPGYRVLPMQAGRRLRRYVFSLRRAVRRVRCPALVIHGAKDEVVRPAGSERLAKRLGSSRVQELVLPRSAHLVTMDFEHRILEDKVAAFLNEVL